MYALDLKTPRICSLKLGYDEPLSKFAVNFRLRRYNTRKVLADALVPCTFAKGEAIFTQGQPVSEG
jgi:hypothetical protein